MNQLKSRDPRSWSVSDVARYLDNIGLGEYKIPFIENDVAGAELVDLTDADAQSLGVRKLGHRKVLLHAVADLVSFGGPRETDSDSASDSGSQHSEGGSTKSGTKSAPTKIKVKAKWDGRWIAISVDRTVKFSDLKKKLRHETRCKVSVSYADADGDTIEIRRSSHLATALDSAKDGVLRLTLTKEKDEKDKGGAGSASSKKGGDGSVTALGAAEASVFDGLRDPVVVIDEFGKMLYVNNRLAQMMGATPANIVGQNVKALMHAKDAESHDFYLWRYMSTREPHILGRGRLVIARRFDGSSLTVTLSVNEAKATNGKTIFVGTLTPQNEAAAVSTSRFALMDAMQQSVIAIDTKGTVLYLNKRFTQMSGYESSDLMGRNINIIMPSPYKEHHDGYLKKYLDTGDTKIIGIGRDVVMLKKDHSILPVNLNVNVSGTGADINYVGVLTPVEEQRKTEDNLLAAQRQVLDSLPVASVLIDQKGIMQVFNNAAQKLFGYSINETLGRNVNLLMPEPEKGKHDSYLRNYMKNGRREDSTVIGTGRDVIGQRKNGEMFSVHLSVTEHQDVNGHKFFSAILQ